MTELKNESPSPERPLKLFEIIRNIMNGVEDSMDTLQMRAKKWALLYPSGEPMYKRPAAYRVVIHADEISKILGMHLRTAQKMLQNTRFVLGLPKMPLFPSKSFALSIISMRKTYERPWLHCMVKNMKINNLPGMLQIVSA